jgi:hypothetical protein
MCAVICDFDVVGEIQDRGDLREADGCRPDCRDRVEGDEEERETTK